ncbi:MAG TPA: cellulose biosynthesis protein CelD, partial [Bradyrhizobium sp.]|nr:cellulose biosynthesis protein CelD [Bradyrhizobium sp.]
MTVLTAARGTRAARDISRAAFRVEFLCDWKQAAARWSDVTPLTPFQDNRWLDAWYEAFADLAEVQPLIAIVTDAATGELAALLPLILRLHKGIRIVEFADLALTDYNAPLLGAGRPRDIAAARALWRDLTAALRRLPDGCDLIRLRKMPAELGQVRN